MTRVEIGSTRTTRRYGDAAIASAALAVLVGAIDALSEPSVPITQWSYPLSTTMHWVISLILVVVHALQAVAYVGLTLVRPYGAHRLAHVMTLVAVAGFVVFAVAELASGAIGGQAEDSAVGGVVGGLFGVGTLLTAVGGLVAGTVILRRQAWTGLAGWSVLLTALVVLFAITPANLLSEQLLRAISLMVWSLLFVPLGLALRRGSVSTV